MALSLTSAGKALKFCKAIVVVVAGAVVVEDEAGTAQLDERVSLNTSASMHSGSFTVVNKIFYILF